MKKGLIASLRVGLATFVMLFATNLLPVLATTVSAVSPNDNPPGNNGTLKVHEFGTPDKTENNDPKVCAFNLEGFDLDVGQTGYLMFDVQGGDGPTGTAAGPFAFGPTTADPDHTSYAASQYFNTPGGAVITNGHYKVTLFGKDLPNGTQDNEKAKSKVFKVDCTPAPTPVTAGVTIIDLCGTANDSYIVPTTSHVTYSVPAGTYPGTGSVTVTASADTGYVISGDSTFSHTFTNVACPPEQATAGVVTYVDLCGTANDTYTVPTTAHVTYSATAGTHAGSGAVTVTASADAGYALTAPYTFTHTFTNEACPPEQVTAGVVTYVDTCGKANDSYTVPVTAHVTYSASAGVHTGATGTVTVTATAAAGYVLTAPYTFTHAFTNDKCPKPPKVTICHATSSAMNPYVKITVSQNAVDGVAGNSGNRADHYGEHKGDVFNPLTMQQGDDWGDIIPPVSPFHNGLNWTTEGQVIYRNHCNVPPVVIDVCPNIEGVQTTVPSGKVVDNEGNCVTPPVDVCPNVEGNQSSIPSGMVEDDNGDCVTPPPVVTDVCPNMAGDQTSVPAGMSVDINGNCFTPGQGGGEVLGITTVAAVTPAQPELVNTGHNSLTDMIVGLTIVSLALTTAGLARRRQTA